MTGNPTQLPAISGSNSLSDLAARIRSEHEACTSALQRGIEHAVAAGKLLIEAREHLAHGQWLPWLRDHCSVPERSARRYIELAAYAAESKSASLADFALGGAAEALTAAVSFEQAIEAEDWDLATRHLLDGPFNASDTIGEDGKLRYDWMQTKLLYQLKLPLIADWCFSVAHTEGEKPPLRLCPWDQLFETAKTLVPLAIGKKREKAEGKLPVSLDAKSFDSMGDMQGTIVVLQMVAGRMLGAVLEEIDYRQKIGDERYEREWDETHRDVMARLDAKLASLEAAP